MKSLILKSLLILLTFSSISYAVPQFNYKFKVRTKQGSIVNNITIHAKDIDAAKFKLNRKYKDCQIMNSSVSQ